MTIDYGKVKKYISERGFGFVTHNLSTSKNSEVFFHISAIKKSNLSIANKLNNESSDDIFFWYKYESSSKGEQLVCIIDKNSISKDDLAVATSKLENIWLNISRKAPYWLEQATKELLGNNSASDFVDKRERLLEEKERQKQVQEEEIKKIQEQRDRQARIQEQEYQRIQDEQQRTKEDADRIKREQFEMLVDEISQLGFTKSSDVSNYIVRNKLGLKKKYQDISGVLEMSLDGNTWNFNGGFPKDIYRELCEELGLTNNGSRAQAGRFTSFRELRDF